LRGWIARAVNVVLHVDDTPHRIALSFGLGVWIAFCPLLGIHTGLALGIAFAFRLSRTAILAGAYVNNPWTVAPLYMAGSLVGCALLGVSPEGLADIDWSLHGRAFYAALFATLRPYVWPFVVGNVALGLVAAVVAYVALRMTLERRQAGSYSGGAAR
jgi:uncharacterized protein